MTTSLLTRADVRALIDLPGCIDVVEAALMAPQTIAAGVSGTYVPGGGFHVKTAGLGSYFAAKINANFPGNPNTNGLPTIQGVIALYDVANGSLLALLDSTEITTLRTAAMTAVAAKYLARTDARVVTVLGCGIQGRAQLQALLCVRAIERVFAWDANPDAARRLAAELGVEVCADYRQAARTSDVVLTCTPAHEPILAAADIAPGCFVAAVGADSDAKNEIAPALLAASHVVADVLEQCARIGDLHHALEAHVMTRVDVYGELSEIVTGRKPPPNHERPIIFDSTGTALTDVAAAAAVYERMLRAERAVQQVNFREESVS